MKNDGSYLTKTIPLAAFALFVLVLAQQPLMAQSQTIGGRVVDPTGATVPDAAVTIEDVVKGGIARQTVTNPEGQFQAISIEPGRYSISVEKAGFKKAQVTVTLDVNTKLDVGQITLQVGNVSDVVSVTAEATPLVTVNTMDKSFVVDKTQISELPMNGRNFTSLMSTVPGMTSAAQSDFNVNFNDVSQFHSLGGRGSENNMYLDGSPNIDVGDNQSQYTQASVDTIAEFRVLQSGFNAEYGRNSGMVIAVQTKSGASQFHGTAYEYFRNNALDAKCVLCNTLQPQLRYNQFGGNFSGWVPKPKISTRTDKKKFFFYNREMTRRNLPGSAYADVPNASILSGNFTPWLLSTNMQYAPQFKNGTVFEPGTITRDGSGNITGGTPYPNNTVPQSQWNPMTAAILKIYTGIPGYGSLAASPNQGYLRYFYNNPDNLLKNQDMLRVDYTISSKMNSFFRWVNDYQKETIQTGIWSGEPFPMQPQYRPKPGSSWAWNLVDTFTPTLSSETILSYNHQSQKLAIAGSTNPLNRNALGANWTQLYPQTNITNSVQDVSTGNGGINFSLGDPGWHNTGKDYSVTENVSWVKGKHTMKFGMFYNQDFKTQTGNWGLEGNINFSPSAQLPTDTGNGLANLMLGNFNNFSQANGAVYPWFRFWEADVYAQDSWKVSKRLTVDFGLRFVHMTPTYTQVRGGTPGGEGTWTLYSVDLSKYNASDRPSINLTNGYIVGAPLSVLSPLGLICDPCKGTDQGFSPSKSFPEPRVGIAYDLFGDGKTAIRAGFATFNERLRQNNFNFGAGAQWPNLLPGTSVYNGNVTGITAGTQNASAPIQPPNMSVWPTNDTMPSIYSWYVGVQRELPAKFALDVSYSGNHAVHLMDQRQVNALPAGSLQNNNLAQSVNYFDNALLPYLGWGALTAVETNAYSRYDALLMRVGRRFSHNLSFNFNYTFSRVMDIVDNDSDQVNNPFNIASNYAPAGYDQTNVVTMDFVYTLPKVKGALDNALGRQALNGWEVSGLFRTQTGMPITVNSNGNLFGLNLGSQYANLSGSDPYTGSRSQWLNPAAFTRPADGSWGTLGRDALRLPHITNIDASIMKNFAFSERVKVTFRAECFNLLNHTQVWGVNTGFSGDNPGGGLSATDGAFGQPNSWRDARTLQLALRLAF